MAGGSPIGPQRVLGRYALYDEIAAGGMAAVHLGRLLGPVGFSRTVAIKRLHAHYAKDPEFVSMFLDEARLAARIRHPNVVQTLDVVALEGELFLVMEYVQGDSLSRLLRLSQAAKQPVRLEFASAIIASALHGLHAAHEARGERGETLDIVHRDVSPQNIQVGVDGVTRLLDFGVAKASGRMQTTRDGQIKGKIAYMSPEQLRGHKVDRRTDVYAAGAVFWEALTGKRLYEGDSDVAIFGQVLDGNPPPPSSLAKGVPPALDAIVLRALSLKPDDRFPSARDMARALEKAVPLVPATDLGEWVERLAADSLAARSRKIERIESESSHAPAQSPPATFAAEPTVRPAASSAPASGDLPTTVVDDGDMTTQVRTSQSDEYDEVVIDDPIVPTQLTTATITQPSITAPRARRRYAAVFAAAGGIVFLGAVVGLRSVTRSTVPPATARIGAAAEALPAEVTVPKDTATSTPTPAPTQVTALVPLSALDASLPQPPSTSSEPRPAPRTPTTAPATPAAAPSPKPAGPATPRLNDLLNTRK